MSFINAVNSYLIKPITIPRYLTTVYFLRGTAPIGLYYYQNYMARINFTRVESIVHENVM